MDALDLAECLGASEIPIPGIDPHGFDDLEFAVPS